MNTPKNLTRLLNWAGAVVLATTLVLRGHAEPAPSGESSAATVAEYHIQANDLVQLSVYGEDDLNVSARVADDGKIRVPLLGPVAIAGKSVEGATEEIRAAFARDYLVNPRINLVVVDYSKRSFTVLGQVQRPGAYEITAGRELTLLEAIGLAGGLTRIGSSAKVTVQRMVDGKSVTLKLNGDAVSDQRAGSFSVRPNDVINIGEKWI